MTTNSPEEVELDRLNTAGASLNSQPRYAPKVTLWTLICSPFTTLHRILTFITTLFPYLSRFHLNSIPTRRQLASQDTACRFVREFEELYGPRHIPFEQRGYADLTHHVKQNDVYLMVVLVSEEHDDTPAFCRDVLCDEMLSEWVRGNDVVVWGGNVADSEANTVSNSLNCTRYPFVALIANIPSPTPTSPPQMTLLTRIEGAVTTTQLTSTLTSAVTRTRATLTQRRAIKQEQASARELRRMQEEAYTTSLAADRAKQESARLAAENSARLAHEKEEKLLQRQRRAEDRDAWRAWKAADLRKKGVVGLRSEIGRTARVGVRLLGGERIVQMFPGEMALEEVYSFVECYDLLFPQRDGGIALRNSETHEAEAVKPKEYEHEFEFRLVVPYPRKVIDSGMGAVKNEAALWPSGSIVVEEVEEDESEEDESNED